MPFSVEPIALCFTADGSTGFLRHQDYTHQVHTILSIQSDAVRVITAASPTEPAPL